MKKAKTRRFEVITIFPHIFDSYLGESLLKKARDRKLLEIKIHNLRDFSRDRHKKVDNKPFGGGPGMVLKIEPIYKAVQFLKSKGKRKKEKVRTILFSLRGKKLDSKTARRLSGYDRLILICGRYEGVDERVAKHIADEEISIGDYVLSGGELPALVLIEAVSRHIPGFLGKFESLEDVKGSYPAYTRPAVFYPNGSSSARRRSESQPRKKGWEVPKVLKSGHHAEIRKWRGGR